MQRGLDPNQSFGRLTVDVDRGCVGLGSSGADDEGDRMTSDDQVLVEQTNGVLVLTLNRPEKLNAVNYAMIGRLLEEVHRASTDDAIRAVLLRGNGRALSAGDDVKAMGTPVRALSPGEHPVGAMQQSLVKQWFWLRKPTIVAVKGHCHGIGEDLTLAADFRIVAKGAVMGDLRARRAISVGSGGTFLLPLLVGLATATAIMLTGDTIDAAQIERYGLATQVVEDDELDTAAAEFAARMAAGPTKALGQMKYEMRSNLRTDLDRALALELSLLGTVFEDRAEGNASFAEGRTPVFSGR
jgi:2-(1,2-epoxy-1,2-dihydrophenyl)acetyl-CoA isomerase